MNENMGMDWFTIHNCLKQQYVLKKSWRLYREKLKKRQQELEDEEDEGEFDNEIN